MVDFAHPEFLWLTPLAVLVVLWAEVRTRPALRYSDLRLFDGLPRGRATQAIRGGVVLRVTSVVVLSLAAAGPRTPDQQTRLQAEGVAVVLVLDTSGSMAEPDFPAGGHTVIPRLEAAKQAVRLFVAGGDAPDGGPAFPGRQSDPFGLVTFAGFPDTACPLTLDHTALLAILDDLTPADGLDTGTNIGDALAEGLIRLEAARNRRKVLVLLSDGEHNVSRDGPDAPLSPRQAAQLAGNLGVPVYAIDCGGEPPADDADGAGRRADGRRALQAVAAITGGRYFDADDTDELRAAYRAIDALERDPTESFRYRRFRDHALWLALAGVVVIATLSVLEQTRWRQVP